MTNKELKDIDVKIEKKKQPYPINPSFKEYLINKGREKQLPLNYEELLDFDAYVPVYDDDDNDTLWISVMYNGKRMEDVTTALLQIYVRLQSDGREERLSNLSIASIDFCTFGNTKPFRIKVINLLNNIYDYFYIKRIDASRVFGLELEHYLSPYNLNYITDNGTLVEEHIVGIPGDAYSAMLPDESTQNQLRIAKEFVKFNERCYWRLLGDMRAYNFVVVVSHDFDRINFGFRAIDFDQQCYEPEIKVYKPQFFKENLPYVKNSSKHLVRQNIHQYRNEERALIARRIKANYVSLKKLMDAVEKTPISTDESVNHLANQWAIKLGNDRIKSVSHMSELMRFLFQYLFKRYYLNTYQTYYKGESHPE